MKVVSVCVCVCVCVHVCVWLLVAGNVEENNTVSRALSRLSEVQEKVESLHSEQVSKQLGISPHSHSLTDTRH